MVAIQSNRILNLYPQNVISAKAKLLIERYAPHFINLPEYYIALLSF